MFELDEISQLITLDTNLLIPEVEGELEKEGYTLGFFSPPKNKVTFQEALEKNLPNLYSTFYGEWYDLCVAVELELKNHEMATSVLTPRQATGPSFKNLALGSQGEWAHIQKATLKYFHIPERVVHMWIGFSSLEECIEMEQQFTLRELFPRAFSRVPRTSLKRYPRFLSGKWLLVLEWAGPRKKVQLMLQAINNIILNRYPYRQIEDVKLQERLSKIIRQTLPSPGWGGKIIYPSGTLALEKKILNCLK